MSDKSLLDRLNRLIKIAPETTHDRNENSWSENLSTEKKIHAIKITEECKLINPYSQDNLIKKKPKKSGIQLLKKLTRKCKWKLPTSILIFSVLQLFFYIFVHHNITYQTLAFSPNRKLELWRYFTYSLLHAGIAHLFINIILQLVIAFPLETEVGHVNVAIVYIGGILSGSLAASMADDLSLMVGASSGIYALLMSYIPHIFLNFSTISFRFHRMIFVGLLSISDIVYAIFHCMVNGNKEPKIHYQAHVFGALSGIVLGFIFFKCENTESRDENQLLLKIIKWTSIAIYLSFIVAVIIIDVVQDKTS
ncbi:CLUMA_CG018245, isoform A [Clunio marinus]|uniref:CLUMA_CG018245, isoform A n=1 Tax=Clunio marinus TaxID=568069 RepID=A0A1J1IY36_9DIPT|nr:CLUMA_CG018245, isoform A [Clunio marinus]